MRDLFEQLSQTGEPTIDQLIAERVEENIELEFKTKANPANGELTREDRKNLGIALSALSNSMGGLMIWGVVAAKNLDGIDCASHLAPISEIERFKNEIERAVSQAIMPRHDGIRISIITCSSRPESGYLAILIERSERRPHRCEFGEKQYFKRVGDSSIAMEHYDIEDSFKRFAVPSLQVEYHLSDGGRREGPDGAFATVSVIVLLKNTSQVSARFPYLIIDINGTVGITPSTWNVHRGLQQAPGVFYGTADDVIHPELSIRALELQREFRIRDGYLPRGTLQGAITISFRAGCLNSRPAFRTIQITEEEVAAALNLEIA